MTNMEFDQKEIEELIKNNELAFEVYEKDGGGEIVGGYCNVGGCNMHEYVFDSLELALREAAIMTLKGQKPRSGTCKECWAEMQE